MGEIPKETLGQALVRIQDDSQWLILEHFGFGMAVRNALRKGGFAWDAHTLDNIWVRLVVEAARRTRDR